VEYYCFVRRIGGLPWHTSGIVIGRTVSVSPSWPRALLNRNVEQSCTSPSQNDLATRHLSVDLHSSCKLGQPFNGVMSGCETSLQIAYYLFINCFAFTFYSFSHMVSYYWSCFHRGAHMECAVLHPKSLHLVQDYFRTSFAFSLS
jgi:hypothetical protein